MKLRHPNLAEILDAKVMETHESDFCASNSKKYRVVYNLYAYSLFN
jgi:hypothetical protein